MTEVKRSEIEGKYKWKLEDMVDGDKAWEKLFEQTDKMTEEMGGYAGKLTNADTVFECLVKDSAISQNLERLFIYARMRRDEDSTVSLYQGLSDRAMGLVVKYSSIISYMVPELSAMPLEKLQEIAKDSKLKDYDRMFLNIIRQKEHILSDKEEKLMALSGEVGSSFSQIFGMMDNADHKFPTVKDENGKPVKVTHGTYSVMLQKQDKATRKRAYNAYYKTYKEQINTLTAVYSSVIKKDLFSMFGLFDQ